MSRLYVDHISSNAKIEELRSLFEEYGTIKSFGIKEESTSGYMEYDTPEQAKEAINHLNNKEFCGMKLLVEFSRRPLPKRSGTGPRFRNGGRRRRSNPRRYESRSSSPRERRRRYSRRDSRSRSRSHSRSRSYSRKNRHHRHHRHSRRSRSSKSS